MTFWEMINNMSDFIFVFFWTFFVLFVGAILIYSLITKRSLGELMEEGAQLDLEKSETIKRLDKLQDTLDCLASEHLDGEAMKELQGASEESEKPYISPFKRPINEKDLEEWSGAFYSFLDRMIVEFCKDLNKTYDKIPDWDKVRSLRQASKRQKLEKNIEYDRFCINLCGFIQAHGFDAFEHYLRQMCFMPTNDEAIERKNNLVDREDKPDEV